MRDNDHLILEDIYMGKVLLSEKIYGNLGWVYHRTRVNPEEALLSKEGIKPSANSSAAYGKGLYCCYDIDEQFKGTMRGYGRFILKGKVDLRGFVILDKDVFELARPKENFENYLKSLNIDLEKYNEKLPFTSDIASQIWDDAKRRGANGIVFTGRNDGKVAVIWTRQNFIPYQYASDIEETRTTEGWSGTRIIQTPKDLKWINLNPNISHIKRPFDPEYDKDEERDNISKSEFENVVEADKDVHLWQTDFRRDYVSLPKLKIIKGSLYASGFKNVSLPNLEEVSVDIYIPNSPYVNMINLKKVGVSDNGTGIQLLETEVAKLDSLEECRSISAEKLKIANLSKLYKCPRWIMLPSAEKVDLSRLLVCDLIVVPTNIKEIKICRELLNVIRFEEIFNNVDSWKNLEELDKKPKIIYSDESVCSLSWMAT